MLCCGIRMNGSCFSMCCCFCDLDALRPAAKGPPRADPSLFGGTCGEQGIGSYCPSSRPSSPFVRGGRRRRQPQDKNATEQDTLLFSSLTRQQQQQQHDKNGGSTCVVCLGFLGRLLSFDKPAKKKTRRRRREGRSMVMMVLCVRGCGKRRRRRVERF
jgi:hypothetical protein